MTEKLTDFRQLNVWQKAHKLVLEIYEITKKFPKEEKTELAIQMKRAATRIPIKIAEGFVRRNPKDKQYSYKATQESLEALKYYVILATELEYIKGSEELSLAIEELGRMLSGLVRSTRS